MCSLNKGLRQTTRQGFDVSLLGAGFCKIKHSGEREKTDVIPASTSLHQPLKGLSSVRYVLLNEDTFGKLVYPSEDHHGVPPSPSTERPQLILRGPPLGVSEGLRDRHHQQYGVGSGRAEDGPHAGPLAVQAWWGPWRAVRLSASVVIIVSFAIVLRVSGDDPRRGVDHSDPSAVDLRLAHVAVSRLRPRVEDLVPKDGVGSGGLSRLRAPQDEQSALRGVAAPGVTC